MRTGRFSVGDLVWAKMKGFPPWPAKIVDPPAHITTLARSKKGHQCCCFFVSENYSWIRDDQVFRHSSSMMPKSMKGKSVQFRKAVELIFELNPEPEDENTEEIQEENNAEIQLPSTGSSASKRKISGGNVQKSKKGKQDSDAPKKKKSPPKKAGSRTQNTKKKEVIAKKKTNVIDDYDEYSIVDDDFDDGESSSPLSWNNFSGMKKTASCSFSDEAVVQSIPDFVPKRPKLPAYVERSATPEFEMDSDIEDIKDRGIKPSPLKFGFLGLGFIGRILAKRILCSGHHLTVWNRSPEKCEAFIKAGALSAQTPADVVATSDVTFCCFSDTEAVKSIVFKNCGILSGMETVGKKFCVLNTITPEASVLINDAIVDKGGYYLEAFVNGTRSSAAQGKLLVIAGGHREVFDDSSSCFESFARKAFYVDYEVGKAAIMNVLFNSFNGAACLALSESLSFVEKNLVKNSVRPLQIGDSLEETRIAGSELCRKAKEMEEKEFTTDMTVKLMQQSLNIALNLSDADTINSILVLVHEQYKNASVLRYFDHDIAAIHQTTT